METLYLCQSGQSGLYFFSDTPIGSEDWNQITCYFRRYNQAINTAVTVYNPDCIIDGYTGEILWKKSNWSKS